MSSSNAFLPFATGGSPNVISDGVYSSLTARGTGFQSGVAQSNQVNKVLRQAAFVAAMIGQFTADNQPADVLDDGVIANMEAQFEAALKKYLGVYFLPLPPASTFYVNNSIGSDSLYDGTSATISGSHGPWATIAHAITVLQGVSFQGFTATIQLANTGINYPTPGIFQPPSAGTLIIQGNVASQGSYIISGAGSGAGTGVIGAQNGNLVLQGLTLSNSGTTNHLLFASQSGNIQCVNVTFATSVTGVNSLVFASAAGSILLGTGCIFTGNAGYCWLAGSGGSIVMLANQTMSGTPTYSVATVSAQQLGSTSLASGGFTWSGAATGVRYTAVLNGVISVIGGGVNFFPGSSAGSTSTGGQYQ